jgi:cation transport ATPase
MKLSHLLLTMFLACLLAMLLAWLQGFVGVSASFENRVWLSLVPATMVALVVAWPFARLLRFCP